MARTPESPTLLPPSLLKKIAFGTGVVVGIAAASNISEEVPLEAYFFSIVPALPFAFGAFYFGSRDLSKAANATLLHWGGYLVGEAIMGTVKYLQ